MALDINDPEVKAAIEAEATRIAQETVADNYVPASDIEGLKNKNTELLGKLAKSKERFSGLEEADIAELKRVKEARENDEIIDLVLKGKTSEAKTRLTEGVIAPWQQKTADIEAQFNVAQETINEYKVKLDEATENNANMQKRTYLRELTSKDDSFKADHFDDFYALNASKMELSPEDGNVYALDQGGKAVLDTEGNRVTYSDHYGKMKVSNGLFWNGGQGSGAKGEGGQGGHLGKDPSKWSVEQRTEYIREHGATALGELYAKR